MGPCPSVTTVVDPELSVVVIVDGELTVTVDPELSVVVTTPPLAVPEVELPLPEDVEDTPPAAGLAVELGALLLMQLSSELDPIDMTSVLPPVPSPATILRCLIPVIPQSE